jgi:hypothetical protein
LALAIHRNQNSCERIVNVAVRRHVGYSEEIAIMLLMIARVTARKNTSVRVVFPIAQCNCAVSEQSLWSSPEKWIGAVFARVSHDPVLW